MHTDIYTYITQWTHCGECKQQQISINEVYGE